MSRKIGSRGFYAALGGLSMTVFSWYSPWAWPAFPALFLIDRSFGQSFYAEASYDVRAVILIVLIVWNTAVWGVLLMAAVRLLSRLTSRRGVDDIAPSIAIRG